MATDIGRNNRSHVREAKREWKLSNNRNKDNGDGEKGRLRGLGEMSREPACKPCNCVQHNLEEQHDNWVAANNKAREGSRGNANTNQGSVREEETKPLRTTFKSKASALLMSRPLSALGNKVKTPFAQPQPDEEDSAASSLTSEYSSSEPSTPPQVGHYKSQYDKLFHQKRGGRVEPRSKDESVIPGSMTQNQVAKTAAQEKEDKISTSNLGPKHIPSQKPGDKISIQKPKDNPQKPAPTARLVDTEPLGGLQVSEMKRNSVESALAAAIKEDAAAEGSPSSDEDDQDWINVTAASLEDEFTMVEEDEAMEGDMIVL